MTRPLSIGSKNLGPSEAPAGRPSEWPLPLLVCVFRAAALAAAPLLLVLGPEWRAAVGGVRGGVVE